MAGKKKEKEVFFKAVANCFLKYNGNFIEENETFLVKSNDKEELSAYAEIYEEVQEENSSDGEGNEEHGDNSGEGKENVNDSGEGKE